MSNLNQPSADFLSISDTPNENEPMKSFLDVRSQSHTSIKIRRSLSSGLSSLFELRFGYGKRARIHHCQRREDEVNVAWRALSNSQSNCLIPNGIQRCLHCFRLLFHVVGVWYQLHWWVPNKNTHKSARSRRQTIATHSGTSGSERRKEGWNTKKVKSNFEKQIDWKQAIFSARLLIYARSVSL